MERSTSVASAVWSNITARRALTPAVMFNVVVSHLNAARCIEHQPGKHAFCKLSHQKCPKEHDDDPTYSYNSELIIYRTDRILVLFCNHLGSLICLRPCASRFLADRRLGPRYTSYRS